MSRYPPGPTDWLFGLPFVARTRRDPLGHLLRMAQTYGEIAHTRVLGRHVYLIHQPDAVRDILVTKGKSFCKVEQFMRPFRRLDGNGLVFSAGDFWLRQRRLVQPAFHARRLGRYAEAMVDQSRRMVDQVDVPAEEAGVGDLKIRLCHSQQVPQRIAPRPRHEGEAEEADVRSR